LDLSTSESDALQLQDTRHTLLPEWASETDCKTDRTTATRLWEFWKTGFRINTCRIESVSLGKRLDFGVVNQKDLRRCAKPVIAACRKRLSAPEGKAVTGMCF
jgi:hypothetical protein